MITILTDKASGGLGMEMYKKIARSDARIFYMDDKRVEPCYACRGCEEKTFRRCVIRDDADLILPSLVRSDTIIVFTAIVFGGYSFPIKRIADRFALLLSKGYSFNNGELVAGKSPNIEYYVIGTHDDICASGDDIDEDEIRVFKQLVTECHKICGWAGKPIVLPEDSDVYSNLIRKVTKP